jgi:hypothetical protein
MKTFLDISLLRDFFQVTALELSEQRKRFA